MYRANYIQLYIKLGRIRIMAFDVRFNTARLPSIDLHSINLFKQPSSNPNSLIFNYFDSYQMLLYQSAVYLSKQIVVIDPLQCTVIHCWYVHACHKSHKSQNEWESKLLRVVQNFAKKRCFQRRSQSLSSQCENVFSIQSV